MTTRSRPRPLVRSRQRFQVLAATAVAAAAVITPALVLGTPSPVSAYPTANVNLSGHGYGHGIGMGQWGSLGYALGQDGGAGNFSYTQILDHYYGNTTLGTLGTAPAPPSLHGGNVLVAMTQNNGGSLIAVADSGAVTVPGGTTAAAVEMVPNASSTSFTIATGPGCAGPWTALPGSVATATTAAQNGGPIDLCEGGGNIEVHGTLTALFNTTPSSRVVNTVPLEQYVADVAPAESPTSWSLLGGAGPQNMDWGFQQSEAQTVAARSYVESEPLGYGGYADTCDQTCQSYPGMKYESLASVAAALDTAGQVMVTNGTSSVANTEYSASSGGYTTGDQFPAVVDDGDAICIPNSVCNTNHSWTASPSVTSIDAAYPQIGTLSSLTVTSRNGLGDYGGRVTMLTLAGTSGSVSVTGSSFASTMNLLSDWFTLGGQSTATGPSSSGGVGGYWADASNGAVFTFGGATFYGSAGAIKLNKPVVGMAATADSAGYWLVATDGGIFTYGDAHFWGSAGNIKLNKPVVGMAATPDGNGYWLVATDGGIFSYGDAPFHGSTGAIKLNKPIVGMVPTHDGGGYWLMASDGGVFAFGDATFHGSLGANPPSSPVVDVAPTPDGGGYWMLEANGTVVPFGDATLQTPAAASPAVSAATGPMTSIVATTTGNGYLMVDSKGQVFAFGDAPYFGDVAGTVPGYSGDVVGIATTSG